LKPGIPDDKKGDYTNFIQYSSLAIQMIVIIVAGTFGGRWIDKHFSLSFPVFTLTGVIFSVFAAVYLSIRGFLKK